jgi:hypothetical protein
MGNVLFSALMLLAIVLGMVNQRAFILLVVAAAGIPISLMTGEAMYFAALGGMAGQAAWLLAIVVGCLAALVAYLGRLHLVVWRTPMFLLFLVLAAISLSWTHEVLDGLRMLAKLAAPIMFCWVLLAMRPDARFARRIETALYAGCLVSVALAVTNAVTGGALAPVAMKGGLGGLPALAAPFTSPANFSFYILVGALVAYCRLLQSRRLIHGLLFAIFMGTVILAFVRISLAGALLGLAAVHLVRARPMATIVIAALAMFGTVLVVTSDAFMHRMFFVPERVQWHEAITDTEKFLSTVNTSGRTELWKQATRAFADESVWAGAGVGTVDTWINTGNAIATELHSEVFRVRLELGWVGLALFCAGFGGMWWTLVRGLRRMPREQQSVALRASCALLPAYALTLLTDNTINYASGFGVIVYGFAALALADLWEHKRAAVRERADATSLGRVATPV